MMRDLVWHVLVLAGSGALVYSWLAPAGLPTWATVTVSGLVGVLALNAVVALQELVRRRQLIPSLDQTELKDGELVALVGRLVPVDATVKAPFSNVDCVAAFYRIETTGARGGRSLLFEGSALAPCALRTRLGDLRLANYPTNLAKTFRVDRSKYPSAFEAADALLKTSPSEQHGEWPHVQRSPANGVHSASDQARIGPVSTHRRVGPVAAEAKFLSEDFLRANEELSLVATWSAKDQALKSNSYAPFQMRILAWGGREEALRAIRRESAWLAVKALVMAAAAGLLAWGVSSRLDEIRAILDRA